VYHNYNSTRQCAYRARIKSSMRIEVRDLLSLLTAVVVLLPNTIFFPDLRQFVH
jgi:hypothetical protein